MSRGCGKAQRGLTRGQFVGAKAMAHGGHVGAKYMATGGKPGESAMAQAEASRAGTAGSARSGSAGPSSGSLAGGAGRDGGGGTGRQAPQGGAGAVSRGPSSSVSAGGANVSVGAGQARPAINSLVRDMEQSSAAASSTGFRGTAGVNAFMGAAAPTFGKVSQAALTDMANGNLRISDSIKADPTMFSASIPSLYGFNSDLSTKGVPLAGLGDPMMSSPRAIDADMNLSKFASNKQFDERIPGIDAGSAIDMNRAFAERLTQIPETKAQAGLAPSWASDRLPPSDFVNPEVPSIVSPTYPSLAGQARISQARAPSQPIGVPSASAPSIGQVKSQDYQQMADATAANLKAQGIKATPSQINQLAFGSAFLKSATPTGSQIQKLNQFKSLIAKGTPKGGKFNVKNLTPKEQDLYNKLSVEAKGLVDSGEVVMFSPTSSVKGLKNVPESTGLKLDPKTGSLVGPGWQEVIGPIDVPSKAGTFIDTRFYAPTTPEYQRGTKAQIVGRDMPGALADYSQPVSQPSANLAGAARIAQGRTQAAAPSMAGSERIDQGKPQAGSSSGFGVNITPVPHDMSGRMAGLSGFEAAPPASASKPITNQIASNTTVSSGQMTPTPTPPSYTGNWANAGRTGGFMDRVGGNNREDRTSRDGRVRNKVNPFTPGSSKWQTWEDRFGSSQTGDVASTGTFGSTASNGGLIRRDGVVQRGRTRGRFI